MKLGVAIGYWGLGLSSDDQLAIVQEDIRTSGGGRLAAIDAEVSRLEESANKQRNRFEDYAAAAVELGLNAPEDRVLFDANRARLGEVEGNLASKAAKLQEQRTALHSELKELAARRDDLDAEREQRDRDQLEVGQAKRDADDRQAEGDAGDQMAERQFPAEQDHPDDVANQGA